MKPVCARRLNGLPKSPHLSPLTPAMPKKIILDVDPGIVDAMVLCMALFDPEVEVVAITSVGGNVPAQIAARNLQAIVEYLDPPRLPRLGMGGPPESGLPVDARHVNGIDGLGDTKLPVAELRTQHPAEKVICDAVRNNPNDISIITLGPLTNIARAFQRDAELPQLLQCLYINGGTVHGPGNITAVAEFNIFADPEAAKYVLQTPCRKLLIPLDVTNRMLFTLNHMNDLPEDTTRVGALLRSIMMPAFRAYRQCYGLEGVRIHDMIAYVLAIHPEWGLSKRMPIEVETEGKFTKGMTLFDQRVVPEWRNSVDVMFKVDEARCIDHFMKGLHNAAEIDDHQTGGWKLEAGDE